MLVLMLANYQGYLNQDRHFWQSGQEVEVDEEVGKELIQRGLAEEIVMIPIPARKVNEVPAKVKVRK